jgi:hypothetical protein
VRSPLPRKESGKATFESVSRYVRLLGVELPVAATRSGRGGRSEDGQVTFITRLRDEEGLFICVDAYAAEMWFDAWCQSHPLASDAEKRGASWAAHLLNTVDVDARSLDVRLKFFKLDDQGDLLDRTDPLHELAAPEVVPARAAHYSPAGPTQRPWWEWPRTVLALSAATAALTLATAGLLAFVLLDPREDGSTFDPRPVAGDAPNSSRGQVVTAARGVPAKSKSDSSSISKSTARSSGTPGVRATIERHWMKREDQQLSSAYADLSRRFRADPAVGSESAWVARQEENLVQDAIVRVRPKNVKKRSAQAEIVRLRVQARRLGCKEWSGLYTLTRSRGRWLIDSATLSQRSCQTAARG